MENNNMPLGRYTTSYNNNKNEIENDDDFILIHEMISYPLEFPDCNRCPNKIISQLDKESHYLTGFCFSCKKTQAQLKQKISDFING